MNRVGDVFGRHGVLDHSLEHLLPGLRSRVLRFILRVLEFFGPITIGVPYLRVHEGRAEDGHADV